MKKYAMTIYKGKTSKSVTGMLFFVVLFCLLFISVEVGHPSGLAAGTTNFWYFVNGERIHLPLSTEEIAVRFIQGLQIEEKTALLKGITGEHR